MRPVNLIPPEDRRGESAPLRTGALSYVVVGVLALALAAVSGVALLNKQVTDRQAEIASLESESVELDARVQKLASYTSFKQVHDARVLTVDGLAKSRFDWERVLRELALVIPRNVWLTNLNGSVAPEVGESTSPVRAEILGPALELSGCARTHRDVARLVAAMQDIDGVTRVTATNSQKSDAPVAPASSTGPGAAGGGDCQTRSTIPKFSLVAAFDDAPTAAAGAVAPPVAPAPGATPASASDDVAAAQAQRGEGAEDVAGAQQDAQGATDLVPGAER